MSVSGSSSRDIRLDVDGVVDAHTTGTNDQPRAASNNNSNNNEADEYITNWTNKITEIADELYGLEITVGSAAEQSATQAMAAIADGLAGLNNLLDFWPDYKGDDATNARRLEIIQATADLVARGGTAVRDTEEDKLRAVQDQVAALSQKLAELKAEYTQEGQAEQAEMDKIKANLQPAVTAMFADEKAYKAAEAGVGAAVQKVNGEEHNGPGDKTILGGIRWYTDFLRHRIAALAQATETADAAAQTYLDAEQVVVNMQARAALLNHIHKRRFVVWRKVSRSEMVIRVLNLMIDGVRKEEARILSIVGLLKTTLEELARVGEPPYHRPNRKVEDRLCTAVLVAHRESLVDSAFVESARDAVLVVQDWFGDDIPKATQAEIDAIVSCPLYKA